MLNQIKKIFSCLIDFRVKDNISEFQIIFEGSEFEAIIIKNLLENNGLIVFQNNYIMATSEPWLINSGGYKPSTLKIKEIDLIAAKRIINEYNGQKP